MYTIQTVEIDEKLDSFLQELNKHRFINIWTQLLSTHPELAIYCTCWKDLPASPLWSSLIDSHPELYSYLILSI